MPRFVGGRAVAARRVGAAYACSPVGDDEPLELRDDPVVVRDVVPDLPAAQLDRLVVAQLARLRGPGPGARPPPLWLPAGANWWYWQSALIWLG